MIRSTLAQPSAADALRFLTADAVEQAASGHPGAPLGMAEMATALWHGHLRHDPAEPRWINRDRFVLSNGHASMLLYALLHLTGYDLPASELRRFRQLHSRTPGHPEVGVTPGVETSTGPLGQGLANAVGMALAEQMQAARFNRPGHTLIDHHTYVFVGDGCLMEGISHEAASLAGALGLGKLICLYDDNGISIDGEVAGWFRDDTAARFAAYGWQVISIDGHDQPAIEQAIGIAREQQQHPTLICCKTVIGCGAPTKAGGHAVHGAPLGADEIEAMRAAKGWSAAPFEVPSELAAAWDARAAGQMRTEAWRRAFAAYGKAYPALAQELLRCHEGILPQGLAAAMQALLAAPGALGQKVATRKASQLVLEHLSGVLPELFGGSADLTSSNLTDVKASVWLNHATARGAGNYLSYGVREFGMAAVMNGVALHGGTIPYGGTFMAFSDYSRNAIRMAAMMKLRVIHVLTHDSIGLGEDGPTHQPVEHAASLRLIPNNRVWRPCDGIETALAWEAALLRADGPTCLVLTRQALEPFARDPSQLDGVARGGYILRDCALPPQLVLLATGSEVSIAAQAQKLLVAAGVRVRLVSMPCVELFYAQDAGYRDAVLPPGVPRLSVEAGVTWFWRAIVGDGGIALGVDSFGESAPAEQLYPHFGLTPAHVAAAARALLANPHGQAR